MNKVLNLAKTINSLDEYISTTQTITDKFKLDPKLNIALVVTLTKIKSYEIQYFSESYKNGVACIVFERLLSQPPSKSWGLFAIELVNVLKYWVEAVSQYLVNDTEHWWGFLKLILQFIKEIRAKESNIPNILVELTSESLFNIASAEHVNAQQRLAILQCLNLFCAESSREIRFAFRSKLTDYFTKLAWHLSSCGHLPSQYSALEALVRWLVPRGEKAVRAAAAARWFPPNVCPDAAREIFLNSTWMDFFNDARQFLNALNNENGGVTSVMCRRMTIGDIIVITDDENHQPWLDINLSDKSVSILLEPRLLQRFGVSDPRNCEALVIEAGSTQAARLHCESEELTISLSTDGPARVQPAGVPLGGAGHVTVVLSSRVHLRSLHAAMRTVFADKYHVNIDLDTRLNLSPTRTQEFMKNPHSSEENTRFSHPRKRHNAGVGYMVVKSRNSRNLRSPSSASTSSLAQLRDRLAALPPYKFNKEAIGVCAQPQLSCVTEISEVDSLRSSRSTIKSRPCPVSFFSVKTNRKKVESDSEIGKRKPEENEAEVFSDGPSISCLLAATVSTDQSSINDTIELLSKQLKNKDLADEKIVDRLVQEALEAESLKQKHTQQGDSNVITGERKSQDEEGNSEAIENTPVKDNVKDSSKINKTHTKNKCTVVSKSTTDDESNTEAINETPVFVNDRKSKLRRKNSVLITQQIEAEPRVAQIEETDKQGVELDHVDKFFSQHLIESEARNLISPSLARKLNKSSSEESEIFDNNCLIKNVRDLDIEAEPFQFCDIDVEECLNAIVDKVSNDILKLIANQEKKLNENHIKGTPPDSEANTIHMTPIKTRSKKTEPLSKRGRNVKLTYNTSPSKKTKLVKKIAKTRKNQRPTKMSIVIEQNDEDVLVTHSPTLEIQGNKIPPPLEDSTIKKKRKLYSPKDDITKVAESMVPGTNDSDIPLAKIGVTTTTYKELEKEKQTNIRRPRSIKCPGNYNEPPSLRTLKNDAEFDKLKATVENTECTNFYNKNNGAIYNFSSDSEDEDFLRKKSQLKQRISSTTVDSLESAMSTRGVRTRRRSVYPEKSSTYKASKMRPVRKKTAKKGKSKINAVDKPVRREMEDERMRDTTGEDILNTSLFIEKPKTDNQEVEFVLKRPLQTELIDDYLEVIEEEAPSSKKKKPNKRTKRLQSAKKEGSKTVTDNEDSGTLSPLPGLIIETETSQVDEANDLTIRAITQKLQGFCQDKHNISHESSNSQNMVLPNIEIRNSPQNREEEIILERKNSTDEGVVPESISHNKSNFQTNEIDNKSDVSISTDGITAHGDLNESPVKLHTLTDRVYPREMADLNECSRNYLLKAQEQLYGSLIMCKNSNEHNSKEPIQKLPVVSICRLPDESIARWVSPTRFLGDNSSVEPDTYIIETAEYVAAHNKISKDNTSVRQKNTTSKNDTSPGELELSSLAKKSPKTKNLRRKSIAQVLVDSSSDELERPKKRRSTNERHQSKLDAMSNAAGTSSVEAWLRGTVDSPLQGDSLQDTIQNAMEKLNTMLKENDENSTQKTINMHAELANKVENLAKQQREEELAWIGLLDKCATQVNEFAVMINKRLMRLKEEYTESKKRWEQINSRLVEDCNEQQLAHTVQYYQKRREIVRAIQSDLQAALALINNKKTTSNYTI